jgi:hypothetical protein
MGNFFMEFLMFRNVLIVSLLLSTFSFAQLKDVTQTAKTCDEIVKAVAEAQGDISCDGVRFDYSVCKSREEACQLEERLELYGRLGMYFATGWVHFDRAFVPFAASRY